MDQETRIALLEEQLKDLKFQQGRTISHVESEQRVRTEQGKRLDQGLRDLERIKDQQEKHDSMLRNNGSGLMFRVAKLEFRIDNSKENITRWSAIAALLLTLINILSKFVKI